MKFMRYVGVAGYVCALCMAGFSDAPPPPAKGTGVPPTAPELLPLQGKWEGGMLGEEPRKKITISISGDSFHFHRDTNFWFQTTISLPAGTEPKQLLATIKGCPTSQADSIGKVVGAIFKIEGETLTLATGGGGDGTPKSFEATEDGGLTLYVLKRIQP
jgi:uncharacterized protein (TIGR03067 family)